MRSRVFWLAASCVLVAALTVGCSGSSFALVRRPAPASSTAAATGTLACAAQNVENCVLAVPGESVAYPKADDPVSTLTVRQFVDNFYSTDTPAGRDEVVGDLESEDVQTIANENWNCYNGDGGQLVLFAFDSQANALLRENLESRNLKPPRHQLALSKSLSDHFSAITSPDKDQDGHYYAIVFGTFDNVGVYFYYYSAGSLDMPTLQLWLSQVADALH